MVLEPNPQCRIFISVCHGRSFKVTAYPAPPVTGGGGLWNPTPGPERVGGPAGHLHFSGDHQRRAAGPAGRVPQGPGLPGRPRHSPMPRGDTGDNFRPGKSQAKNFGTPKRPKVPFSDFWSKHLSKMQKIDCGGKSRNENWGGGVPRALPESVGPSEPQRGGWWWGRQPPT